MTKLRHIARLWLMRARILWLTVVWGHKLHPTVRVSFSAFLDKSAPSLIFIGRQTIITRGAVILSHDYSRGVSQPTVIGSQCMIGVNAVVLPGIRVGDQCVIGAGAVVTTDIPSNSLVVGNPARVVKSIRTGPYGKIEIA